MFKKENNCNNDIFIDIFNLFQKFNKRWRIKFNVYCKLSFDDKLNNNLDNDFNNDMRLHIISIRT